MACRHHDNLGVIESEASFSVRTKITQKLFFIFTIVYEVFVGWELFVSGAVLKSINHWTLEKLTPLFN